MEEKITLITDRLAEIIGLEELKKLINNNNENINIYFGTAPTNSIHIGYLVPLLKLADFLKAGLNVTILIADVHAMLDNLKTTPELVEHRSIYYETMLKSVLRNLNVPLDQLKFVRGSSFQLTSKYQMDLLKLASMTTLHDAKKAGAEVVKQVDNPVLGGLIYPLMQALDEEYLGVQMQTGGNDQRRIFLLAADALPKLGYKKRIHLMNPMLTAINAMPPKKIEYSLNEQIEGNIADTKMSSSDINSKIDFLDSKNEVKKKINKAYCLEGDMTFNPLMELTKHVIFPLIKNQNITAFAINRPDKYGGKIEYSSYEDVEKDFVEKKLFPGDLKLGVIDCLNNFFENIRQEFSSKEMLDLIKKAYPQ